jgi:hypothetical protein
VEDGRAAVILRYGGGGPGAIGRLESHGDARSRNGGGLVFLLVLEVFDPGHLRVLSARRLLFYVSRNIFHFVRQFQWATAMTLLPFATVFKRHREV